MRTGRTIHLTALILLATIVSFAVRAQGQTAQAETAKLELVPATVELPTSGKVEVQLVLRNKSQKPLKDINLSWYTATGAAVETDGSLNLPQLAPLAETSWILHLSQTPDGLVPGNVYFRIAFVSVVPQVLYGTLAIAARQADEVEKVVSVVAQTSSTVLKEHNPVTVFLVINNKGNQPIRLEVGKIIPSGPDFIEGIPNLGGLKPDAGGFVQLEARDTINIPVQVRVRDAVRPGKHLMVFPVRVTWGPKDHQQSTTLMARQEFDVGILGESEILTALGVPSFLLLPGFLVIVAFTLISKMRKQETIEGESVWKLGVNPYVWAISITLSGLIAFLYPIVHKWTLGTARNYLDGYGLYDVVVVWVGSIGIGVLAWVVVKSLQNFWAWLFVPSEEDSAAITLRKLYLQGLGTSLEQIDYTVDQESYKAFLLQKRKRKQEKIWVGPFIQIQWLKDPKNADLERRISKQLEVPRKRNVFTRIRLVGQWFMLGWFLWQGTRQGEVEIRWRPEPNFTGTLQINLPKNRGTVLSIIHED
jgi:hypothetical protein